MPSQSPQPPLPGFEHIKRYWDYKYDGILVKIAPGQYYVTRHNEILATTLGSCISACINDPIQKIGGMNHFMLPIGHDDCDDRRTINDEATRYGNFAMETLVNEIIKHGGKRKNLEAKLFGGGQIARTLSKVGASNIAFVREYTQTESLTVIAEDLGGDHPRKIVYYPITGRARMKRLASLQTRTIIEMEQNYQHDLEQAPVDSDDIELF